jgi:predicted RNase H-like HicB family nuclease
MARRPSEKTAAASDHPLFHIKGITVALEKDDETGQWMSFVRELDDLGTFGSTPEEALNETVDLIFGYVDSMESRGQKVGISRSALDALRRTPRAA